MSFWTEIGAGFADRAEPYVKKAIDEKFDEYMPKLTEALVAAVIGVGSGIANQSVEQIEKAIPGTVDDKILGTVMDVFNRIIKGGK